MQLNSKKWKQYVITHIEINIFLQKYLGIINFIENQFERSKYVELDNIHGFYNKYKLDNINYIDLNMVYIKIPYYNTV